MSASNGAPGSGVIAEAPTAARPRVLGVDGDRWVS
jgi:hypothetical protein